VVVLIDYLLIPKPETGYLISTPLISPEQGRPVAGASMGHQNIRDKFRDAVAVGLVITLDRAE
jgi:hypothetical protein